MKKKILVGVLAVVVLAVGGVLAMFALAENNTTAVGQVAGTAKSAVVNAAADATGAKAAVQEALEQNSGRIASALGVSEAQADAMVDSLDIASWEAIALPADAQEAATLDGAAFGVSGSVTTYDDPTYLTVNAYGQTVTFAVPESAQAYLPSLALLG